MSQLDLHAPVLKAILGLEDLRFISLTSLRETLERDLGPGISLSDHKREIDITRR